MNSSRAFLIFILAVSSACAPSADKTSTGLDSNARFTGEVSSASSELQTLPRDTKFEQLMSGLDFNARGSSWQYKTGGTSLGLSLHAGDKKIGKWLPKNSAADPEAQVVAYRLGRYLQMSENVAPSAYHTVRGAALQYFARLLNTRGESNQWREENRQNLLRALNRDPSQMFGAFTDSPNTYEVTELEDLNSGTINARHPLAGFIRADGAMPSDSRKISFKDIRKPGGPVATETELELARQLSKILVLDALMGQWDRWSGGNLEAAIADAGTRVYFINRDNGGANLTNGSGDRSLTLVTRFDADQIEQVRKLVAQLGDPAQRDHVVSLLELRSNPRVLLSRAQAVLAHVDRQVQRFGDRAFFRPE